MPLSRIRRAHLCRPLLLVLVTALGASALTVSALPAERASIKWKATRFQLQSGESVAAERGLLRVAESRSGRNNRRVQLQVVRFASTAADPGPPIVLLEGGPGLSGLDAARGRRYELIELFRRYGDVLILDHRGVGGSRPMLGCDQSADVPLDQELTRQAWLDAVGAASGQCADEWAATGTDLQSYNTFEAADDIDELRQALGVDQVILWGQSYGTLLALHVIQRHPEGVAAMILHGVLGPDHFVPLPRATDKVLRALGRHAAAAGRPGMIEALREVVADLAAGPVDLDAADPATGQTARYRFGLFELQFMINFIVLGDHSLMARLPGWIDEMRGGDFSSVSPLGTVLRRWQPLALRMAVVCSNGITDRRQRKVDKQAETSLLGQLPKMSEFCGPWGVEPLGKEVFDVPRSEIPMLLISGTFDPVTPPGNAKWLARRFPRAQQLSVVRGTHSDLVHGDPHIATAIDDFLAGRDQSTRRIVLDDWVFP